MASRPSSRSSSKPSSRPSPGRLPGRFLCPRFPPVLRHTTLNSQDAEWSNAACSMPVGPVRYSGQRTRTQYSPWLIVNQPLSKLQIAIPDRRAIMKCGLLEPFWFVLPKLGRFRAPSHLSGLKIFRKTLIASPVCRKPNASRGS